MIETFTGRVNTNAEFVSLATITGINFTVGNTYLIQTNAITKVKLGQAEIEVFDDKPYQWIVGSDELLFKSDFCGCKLTILGNENN